MTSVAVIVQVISAENYVGWSEAAKCAAIAKVFDDAYKVTAALEAFVAEHPEHTAGSHHRDVLPSHAALVPVVDVLIPRPDSLNPDSKDCVCYDAVAAIDRHPGRHRAAAGVRRHRAALLQYHPPDAAGAHKKGARSCVTPLCRCAAMQTAQLC